MPQVLVLLLVAVILVVIGYYVPKGIIAVMFYVLALVVAAVAVYRLLG